MIIFEDYGYNYGIDEAISKKKKSKQPDEEDREQEQVSNTGLLSNKEEEINAFRNRLQIRVKGDRVPPPVDSFHRMKISPEMKSTLLNNIEKSFWKEPTPIQMQSIPILLSQRDILAAAPTGIRF